MRFAFGCGGTGGHIFPALAIAEELRQQGHDVTFIGNRDGMEARLIPAERYTFHPINAQKFNREFNLRLLMLPFRSIWSVTTALRHLRKQRIDAVICTGGFVSGPVALAAILLKLPLYFHESNSFPGITTRLLTRYTRITFVSYTASRKFMNNAKLRDAGVPLMCRTLNPPDFDITSWGLSGTKPLLLVTGGSQGSLAINNAVDKAIPDLLDMGYEVVWQCGKLGYATISEKYANIPGVYVFDFSPHLTSLYRHAAIAITRAGALTLAELEVNHLPAILIPLPTAAENHQHFNAMEQQKKGVAILLPQKELDTTSLLNAIDTVSANMANYQAALASLPANTAAADISNAIISNMQNKG